MPERILTHASAAPLLDLHMARVVRLRLKGARLDTEVHGLDDRSIEIYGGLSFYNES